MRENAQMAARLVEGTPSEIGRADAPGGRYPKGTKLGPKCTRVEDIGALIEQTTIE